MAGGAISGYLSIKATSTWFKVVDLHGKVIATAEGITGVITGQLATLHGLTQTPIPGATYNNERVRS